MKPVDQTKFGHPEGNCFAACVASILEMPIEMMPELPAGADHTDDTAWWNLWRGWLTERGLTFVVCPSGGELYPWRPRGFTLAGGKSPRGDFLHQVVAFDGEIVHDPHPSRAGLDGAVKDWTIFYPLDPTGMFRGVQHWPTVVQQ